MKRILAIDGGGQRGIAPAVVLGWFWREIAKARGVDVRTMAPPFDLMVGTSTGGILACGLAHTTDGKTATYTPDDLLQLYMEDGPKIFAREWYEPAAALRVKYPASNIEPVLRKFYGEVKLSAALTDILITTFDEVKWEDKLFKSRKAKLNPADDYPLWYVSRATAAAPTYFPPLDGLVDGGMAGVTNPAMVALTEARKVWPGEEIFLLSLGTGRRDSTIDAKKSENWGQLEWLSHLITMFLDGPEKIVEREVSESLPADRYVRIQKKFTGNSPDSAFDNASPGQNRALQEFGMSMIAENLEALQAAVGLCA